uniref:Ferric-chelate reductase 1a n=1 Tax=Sinocyclocheilus rhinocerous TaxID=307959 RepID=A0A673IKJ3_9TELE
MWNLQTALAILRTLCLTSISGYKNGKVEKSCESMMPEHHSQPNTTASPYTLTVNTSQFSPGDNIGGKGRNVAQNKGSAVSHTSNAKKTEIQPFIVRILVQFTSVGCGKSKSCLIDPVGCNPSVDTNCFFLSYSALGQTVSFELSGPAQGYVSFALSKDEWMGDDDAYLCINDEGLVSVKAHDSLPLPSVLTDVGWRVSDGVIQCKFSRSIYTPQDPVRFSLNNSYYLFVAHGSAEYGEHTRQPLISSHHQIITGPPEILTASRSPLVMKCHGALMLIAWRLAGSTGKLMAAYFIPDWPEQTLFGQKIWFQVCASHVAVSYSFAGFVFPFFYRGKWSTRAGAHPYLGCTVMILAFCQQSFLFLRRWIFNSSHWGVGNAAEIIAVVSMFFGIKQQSLLLPYPWTTGVLSAFVVWTIVLKLVLKLHKNGSGSLTIGPRLPHKGMSITLKPSKKYMMSLFLHLNRFGEVQNYITCSPVDPLQ